MNDSLIRDEDMYMIQVKKPTCKTTPRSHVTTTVYY